MSNQNYVSIGFQCTSCKNELILNKNFTLSQHKRGRKKCSPCQKKLNADYHRRNPKFIREYNLNYKYGISVKDFNLMLHNQDNKCAICKIDQCEINKNFCVDHCHSTKKVRGLLCSKCNISIGKFKDDINILKKAVKYLSNVK